MTSQGCCCLNFSFFTFIIESKLLSVGCCERAMCNFTTFQPEFNYVSNDDDVSKAGENTTQHIS